MTQRADLPTYHELRLRFEALLAKLAHAEQAARESELRRVALEGELGQLRLRLAQLDRHATSERAAAESRRRELDDAKRDAQQARRLAGQRKRDLDQVVGIAMVALRSVREDVERIETSTAWRVGHRAARTAARARFRPPKTAGAVVAARDRIDGVLEMLSGWRGELPGGSRGSGGSGGSGGETGSADETGTAGEPPPDPRAGPEAKQALAASLRARLGAVPERPAWPGVSIVVRNHNGEPGIGALLDGLRATDYPVMELVVFDLASTDGSGDRLEQADLPFPSRIVRKEVNLTLAAAGNEAAELAAHPLLLFLDVTAEPFEPGWCKELVDGLLSAEAGAIGATLLRGTDGPAAGAFPVHQRGLVLSRAAGLAELTPRHAGADPLGASFGIEAGCVAASGVCLLVDRSAFWRAGGFDGVYGDGFADVDLGLALTAAGQGVVCSGRGTVLYDGDPAHPVSGRRWGSQGLGARRLAERWGPALWRELRLGLARRDPARVGAQTLHVGLARTANDPAIAGADHHVAAELGQALGALGWTVSYLERRDDSWYALEDVDVLIALSDDFEPGRIPPAVTAIAWVRESPQRWLSRPDFDRYDIVLAASGSLAEVITAATGREPVVFPLATNPSRFTTSEPVDELASDYCVIGDRGASLEIESALSPRRGERVALYGRGWGESKPLRSHARGAIADERLPAVLASTQLLIDDQPEPERDAGPLPARVFDALAGGTAVITGHAGAARELFDEEFPVWSDAPTLRAQLDGLLGAPAHRNTLARRYRRAVLARHTYGHRAERLCELIRESDERLSFCLKIGAPDWQQATRWGDLYLARDLERALKRRGHRCLIQVLAEWDEPVGLRYDVAVHLRGRSVYAPRPAQFNVLWVISHPMEVSSDEANTYDLVCVASESFAQELGSRVTVPVAVLEQATDPWRFHPDPDPALAHELAFVGNARGVRRPLLDDLLPTTHDLAVWGSGLAGVVDDRHLQGDWFANEQLRKVYSSAKLVLCDHWEDMRAHGFASNRLYDAVASGAVVVTDAVAGLDDRFGEAVVSYASAQELRDTVVSLLSSDEERERRADGARERLLRGHTFDDRVQTLLNLVDEHAARSGHRARVAPA